MSTRKAAPLATTVAALLALVPFSPAAEISGGAGPARHGLKAPERVPEPKLAPASNEWQAAMKRFRVEPNFRVDLWAAEPILGNPVAFTIDNAGRAFVAETYRYRTSTLDIRHYMFMLEDDLAARTTDDRIAFIKKNFPNEWQKLGIETEVVRLVEDRDRDGRADFSSAYAAEMNTLLDGINSGVLVVGDDVFCTNMPNLWRFTGTTPEGKAKGRESLSFGYGVRFSFTGHDMHGLALGPDGRLYFSFGDRGAHVVTKEGKTLAFPDEGAVFRCELDGSHMEVVHRGLRNPQELAFDKFGNLFTGDNDSDQGDRERWVYVVEGADSGWRVGWQHNPLGKEHNPWLAEKMWEPRNDKQPAYLLPPIANVPDGPSGLTYYPGVGLPTKYENHFFLCGFKGSAARSAISTWESKPAGASFELTEQEVFVGEVQATDVCFGPDSKIYFSEWGEGWEGTGRGRIFAMWDPETIKDPLVAQTQKLLNEGFSKRTGEELVKLLAHKDQRVRLEAQWALAKQQGGASLLLGVAQSAEDQLARLHGIWGLGHFARRAGRVTPENERTLLARIIPLLGDRNEEVRAQTAKVLGDGGVRDAFDKLVAALKDPAPRVRFFAAQALGKLGSQHAVPALVAMLRENADKDAYLRHVGVVALASLRDIPELQKAAQDESESVRMAALLALRRLEHPEVARFLHDKDADVVLEAARAINDLPIKEAMPQLAALAGAPSANEQLMIRVINANYRTGTPAAATALATLALREDASAYTRLEAVRQLGAWAKPPARDHVMGTYRPLPGRDAAPAVAALRGALPKLLVDKSANVVIAAIEAVAALDIRAEGPALAALMSNKAIPAKARAKALETLAAFDDPGLGDAVKLALTDKDSALRVEALAMLGKLDPEEASTQLSAAFGSANVADQKTILTTLGGLKGEGADRALASILDQLAAGKVAPELQLELIDAAAKRKSEAVKTKLAAYQSKAANDPALAWQPLLAGGSAAAGEKLFKEHAVAQCFRCHKVQGAGGDAGPDLTGIAARKDRAYILESIVNPNAKISEGFQMVMITKKNGEIVAGNVKSENGTQVVLQIPGQPAAVTVATAEIKERANAPSGMPPGMDQLLTKREIRDIVEYVASLK
jgi:quinoprotein glucose dehydrogenase